MTVTSKIANDSRAARRFRWVAPLVVLLGLALLTMTPGIIAGLGDDGNVGGPRVVIRLAPDAPEG